MQQSGDEPMKCPGLVLRAKTRRNGRSTTRALTGKIRPEAQDWIVRSGTSSRSRRPPDWIIQGQVGAWRPGLDHPGLTA